MEKLLDFLDYTEHRLGLFCTLLTVIEYFTPYADNVEKFIDSMEDKLHSIGDKITGGLFYQILFTLSVPATIVLLFRHVAEASPTFDITWNMWLVSGLRAIVYTTYGLLSLYLISALINLANSRFNGQAIGGIGIILGLIASLMGIIDKIFDK